MEALRRAPARVLAALVALVAVASANLSVLGVGSGALLYDAYALPRMATALVLIPLTWALWSGITAREGPPLRVDSVWLLLVALAAWGALSTGLSPHRVLSVLGQSERLEGLATLVLYAAAYGVALQVVRRVGDVRRIAVTLCGAAALVSVVGMAQYAGFAEARAAVAGYSFDIHRAFATFDNPNFLASLLVLAFPVCLGVAVDSRGRFAQIAWALSAVLVGTALFVTFTRAAWVAAVLELLVGTVLWRRMRPVSGRATAAAFLSAGAIALVAVVMLSLASPQGELNVANRLGEALRGTGSSNERAALVGIAGSAIAQRPLTGWGPDAFLPAFRANRSDTYVASFGADATINNAHSWPLQYAVTVGVPGALLLIAAVGLALARGRSSLRQLRDAGPGSATIASVWVGCAGFAVTMLGGVAAIGATLPFWILLGAIAAPKARDVAVPSAIRRTGPAIAVTLSLVLAAAAVSLVAADRAFLLSREAFHGGDAAAALALAQRAARLDPVSPKFARGACQARSLQVEQAIAATAPVADVRALYATAAGSYDRFLERNPEDYPALAWLAALQARTGRYLDDPALRAKARDTARRAALLDRQHPALDAMVAGDTVGTATARAAAVPPLP